MSRITFHEAVANRDILYLGRGNYNGPDYGFKGWAFNTEEDTDSAQPGDYFGVAPEMIYFISRHDPNVNKFLTAFGRPPLDEGQAKAPEQHITVEPGALDNIPLKDLARFMRAHNLYLDARDGFTIRRNQ